MQDQNIMENSYARPQLRGVVITVIAAKLAVFALLLTTVNLPSPATTEASSGVEISALN